MYPIRDCNLWYDLTAKFHARLDDGQPVVNRQHSDWQNGYFITAVSKSGATH
jgi:hypothetical protein